LCYIPLKASEGKEKVMPATKDILVRGIPCKLHKRMKIEAARQERTLSDLTITAFDFYLRNGRRLQIPLIPQKKACN